MKDFFDRSYYGALDQDTRSPYACLICAGSDGHNAARQIERIANRLAIESRGRAIDRLHPRPDAEAIRLPSRLQRPSYSAARHWAKLWLQGSAWVFFKSQGYTPGLFHTA